jgi:hypothetical protein
MDEKLDLVREQFAAATVGGLSISQGLETPSFDTEEEELLWRELEVAWMQREVDLLNVAINDLNDAIAVRRQRGEAAPV